MGNVCGVQISHYSTGVGRGRYRGEQEGKQEVYQGEAVSVCLAGKG